MVSLLCVTYPMQVDELLSDSILKTFYYELILNGKITLMFNNSNISVSNLFSSYSSSAYFNVCRITSM